MHSPTPEIIRKQVILELKNWFALGQPQHKPTPASRLCLDLINSSVLVNCERSPEVKNTICVQRLSISPAESLLSYFFFA